MPYSLPIHSQGRAGHRRSYSHITTTSPSSGDLPRRRSSSNIPLHYPTPATPKKPTFHFRQDEEDDDDDDHQQRRAIHDADDDDDEQSRLHGLPPLRLKINSNSSFNAVPFPRSSPLCSPPLRSSVSRTSSSNGKPLKSSLKSSSSSPNIPFPSQSLVPSIMFPDLHPGYYNNKPQQQQQHQRAQSAPCTPLIDGISFRTTSSPLSTSPSTSRSPSPPLHQHHHTPKNVHFASHEEGGLATIRVFNKSAKPASLGRLGEETETETEGEGSGAGNTLYGTGGWAGWSGKYVGGSTYPFPRVAPPAISENKSPLNPSRHQRIPYDIDWSQSSMIPRKNVHHQGNENIFFESLHVVLDSSELYLLQGTLLVRNITYQKTVMVRYTMDEWETVNDVLAWYIDVNGEGWDRFKFSISLEGSSSQELEKRVVWLVGRYVGASVVGAGAKGGGSEEGEWWDNNEGRNYKVGFRKVEAVEKEKEEKPYKRSVVVSAPPTYISPTPTSTLTRPKLSAPQISSSSSFPSSRFSGHYQYQQQEQEREKEQHQAALTQSTLARLKKLNLKNYAAPRGYAYGQQTSSSTAVEEEHLPIPPVLTLTSPSPTNPSFVASSGLHSPPPPSTEESPITPHLRLNTTMASSPTSSTASTDVTSTDSTPVQTPTQGDDDDDDDRGPLRKELDDEDEDQNRRLRWSLGMENGHFATTIMPPPTPPAGSSINVSSSTTPTAIPRTSSYPYTHVGGGGGGVEMGTSPPFSDLAGSVTSGAGMRRGGGSVYWDWGSAAGAALGGGGEKEVVRNEGWMGYQQHLSSVGSGGSGGGLMPPQRKRGLHQQQQKRGSSSSSSSGSGSDSHSSKLPPAAAASSTFLPSSSSPPPPSSSLTQPTAATSTPSPAPPTAPPTKRKPTPPKLNLPSSTLTTPIATGGVQSPFYPGSSARRGLNYYPQSPPTLPHRHFHSSSSSSTHSNNNLPPSSSASNDAIYQALVREWCFAQGPGPVVGGIGALSSSSSSSVLASGETTPVVGRLTSPLSEGE